MAMRTTGKDREGSERVMSKEMGGVWKMEYKRQIAEAGRRSGGGTNARIPSTWPHRVSTRDHGNVRTGSAVRLRSVLTCVEWAQM
jgi:hypothetical protein